MKTIYLVCNAHLDPVWLWEWEEGAAEALSTFRVAAELCEAGYGLVFNHNEAVLYQWVESYEPALFARIQRLVREGKWHIMGGWFLQPDCNMPSGESFVRQILAGRHYFRRKFGVDPHTAINFDPFGHTRGLVQILAKSGYDSYLFCRPGQNDCPLPGHDFLWIGYDGSEIMASRSLDGYNSALGKAREKIERRLKDFPPGESCCLLWGVGDHGGGPSRQDLAAIRDLIAATPDCRILHATPEDYAADLARRRPQLPRHERDLNAWAVGCYSSQVRLKQAHRRLENELYMVEKMAVHAALLGRLDYPADALREAERDLLFGEFHDILPGSSIQPVEDMSLRVFHHGLETLSRVRTQAFFALAQGQPAASEGSIPVLVYNPHPFPVRALVECEFQMADQNWQPVFTDFTAYAGASPLPTQIEKEDSNLNLDWRKRLVFQAELQPAQINRFDCRPRVLPAKPVPAQPAPGTPIRFDNGRLRVEIDTRTGLLNDFALDGVPYLKRGACRPLVLADNEDPWGMTVRSFRRVAGRFRLMSPAEGTRFSGLKGAPLPSVRVIEDGPVRLVVEALFRYRESFLVAHYKLPRQGTEMELLLRVHWNQKDQMLKLALPLRRATGLLGQVAYGSGELPADGNEAVAQKWLAVPRADGTLFTCLNDGSYGADFAAGELRLSLLRSPAYSGHPIGQRPVVPPDRYTPRIDQGERLFRFWFGGGPASERRVALDREALAKNEKPLALSFHPAGTGTPAQPGWHLADDGILLAACKQAVDGQGWILRLYNPTPQARSTRLSGFGLDQTLNLGPGEIASYVFRPGAAALLPVNLLEDSLA